LVNNSESVYDDGDDYSDEEEAASEDEDNECCESFGYDKDCGEDGDGSAIRTTSADFHGAMGVDFSDREEYAADSDGNDKCRETNDVKRSRDEQPTELTNSWS
jgi:hypothetical protein